MRLRSSLCAVLLLFPMAIPVSASQFLQLPFDQMARESYAVVRGTVGPVTSAWDDAHEVIYSHATVRVSDYLAGFGPNVVMLKEVGGTVGDYTQMAIGFPELREGEEVVLFLTQWEDGNEARIEGYHLGKYLIRRNPEGDELVVHDPVTQGHDRAVRSLAESAIAAEDGMTMREFQSMLGAAWQGRPTPNRR